MARKARQCSYSGFYHVMIRGIGKQILFENYWDYVRFIKTLRRYLEEETVTLYAYCLMENHVHLLVGDPDRQLHQFMKKLEVSYAFYFNHKYGRVGNLFQDRFKSEPVEDEAYYLTVLRYILQNPAKAGVDAAEHYRWSSYRELKEGSDLTDTEFSASFFSSREAMLQYIAEENEDTCMELNFNGFSDAEAKRIIRTQLKIESGTELQSFDKVTRDHALKLLKRHGLALRQIERLTGINRGIVQRA